MNTPKDALDSLLAVRRFRFGDADQIAALELLRMAERLIEMPRVCPDCDGEGETDNLGGECSHCGRACSFCGDGSDICHKCKGTGATIWMRDDVYHLPAARIVALLAERRKVA